MRSEHEMRRVESSKLIGKGKTADVLEYSEGKVCKLFRQGYPTRYAELEFRNAQENSHHRLYECRGPVLYDIVRTFYILSEVNTIGVNRSVVPA
jgi:hypothetical protein